MKGLIVWYDACLSKKPLLTKSVTGFCTLSIGDLIAQTIGRSERYDKMRTIYQGSYGAFYSAPLLHFVYSKFSRLLPGQGVTSAIKKVLIETIFLTPISVISFLFILTILNNSSVSDATNAVRDKFYTSYTASCKFWVFVQFLNFRYIPLQYQVLWTNSGTVFWSGYLSMIRANKSN